MGGGPELDEEKTGYMPWWAIDKAAWREKFAPFYKLTSITEGRTKPLPPWTDADVQEFIKSDPVYGPQLKLVRQGAQAAAVGAIAGGLGSVALVTRHSKGALICSYLIWNQGPAVKRLSATLAFAGGAVVSWAVAEEAANFALGLYKFPCTDANLKFLDWWQSKSER